MHLKDLKGTYNAEGLCFYLVSYILFTGALCSHGVCMVLLSCFGKAERVDVLMPWLPAARQQEAPSDVSRESWSSPGLRASWSPAMPDAAWCDSRTSTCLFRWELGAGASWSLQTSQNRAAVLLPQISVQDEWAFFWTAELRIPLLAKQPWWVG